MNESKISIITPYYNSEAFIEETIKSVLAQTYKNWELILVNDGSKDDSTEIVKNYALLDGRIKNISYSTNINRGKSYARNYGISYSTGNYVTFLDSDDLFLENKLARKMRIFQNDSSIDLVLSNTVYWNSWNISADAKEDEKPVYEVESNKSYEPLELLPLAIQLRGAMPCICSFVVKKNTLKKVDCFNDGFTNLYEDQALIVKLFVVSKIHVLSDYLELYRQHSNSDWHSSLINGQDSIVAKKYASWLINYLENLETENKELNKHIFRLKKQVNLELFRRTYKYTRSLLRKKSNSN